MIPTFEIGEVVKVRTEYPSIHECYGIVVAKSLWHVNNHVAVFDRMQDAINAKSYKKVKVFTFDMLSKTGFVNDYQVFLSI